MIHKMNTRPSGSSLEGLAIVALTVKASSASSAASDVALLAH